MATRENQLICNCKKVYLADIEQALHNHKSLGSVEEEFKEIQKQTHCSTGCGGCYEKVLDVIADLLQG